MNNDSDSEFAGLLRERPALPINHDHAVRNNSGSRTLAQQHRHLRTALCAVGLLRARTHRWVQIVWLAATFLFSMYYAGELCVIFCCFFFVLLFARLNRLVLAAVRVRQNTKNLILIH